MISLQPFEMLCMLMFGHFLADYAFNNEFIVKGRNRAQPLPDTPWYQVLFAHSALHGGFVGIFTGSVWLGLAETVIHFLIDDAKCTKKLDRFGKYAAYNIDQFLHFQCKILWVGIAAYFHLPNIVLS